jgi:hypothetical protein
MMLWMKESVMWVLDNRHPEPYHWYVSYHRVGMHVCIDIYMHTFASMPFASKFKLSMQGSLLHLEEHAHYPASAQKTSLHRSGPLHNVSKLIRTDLIPDVRPRF